MLNSSIGLQVKDYIAGKLSERDKFYLEKRLLQDLRIFRAILSACNKRVITIDDLYAFWNMLLNNNSPLSPFLFQHPNLQKEADTFVQNLSFYDSNEARRKDDDTLYGDDQILIDIESLLTKSDLLPIFVN